MSEIAILRDLVVVFAVAVVVVLALRRLRVPSIVGFLVVGALVGPRALGLVDEVHDVEILAEVGVVLLLFGIGLELSLDRLKRLWRPVLVGGALQVGITSILAVVAASALRMPLGRAILSAYMLAVSSTAIVLRILESRGEIEAPHGRLTLGILVFQDLCVVPMMLTLPLLAHGGGPLGPLAWAMLKAVLVLAGVLAAARLVVPRLMHVVARTRQRDLFVLTVFLTCLGTAWVVSRAGVSLALGAFLGGLVVAGSEYRHQALADLIPLREVLASIFFVSVGMLLDPVALVTNAIPILGVLAAVMVGKFAVVLVVGSMMRLPLRVSALSAAALCQVGEFSFVLLRAGSDEGLVTPALADAVTAVAVLSMLATPLVLAKAPQLAAGVGRSRMLTKLLEVRAAHEAHEMREPLEGHVVVAGLGVAGVEIVTSLRECEVPYLAVDLNPDNVRGLGPGAFFGDVTSAEVLEHLHVAKARQLVVAINDPAAAERAVRAARAVAPDLTIVARARYVLDGPRLVAAGANDVVFAEVEAAVELAARVLRRCELGEASVEAHLARIRGRRGGSSVVPGPG